MSDALILSQDGKSAVLTCQNPDCGATSAPIRVTPVASGTYWCGICGEWGFNFDIVGLTEEQMWPEGLDLVKLSGPLGPDGAAGSEIPVNINPRWIKS
jgi:hypothetical protein